MTDTVDIGQSPESTQTVSIGPSTPPMDVDTARLKAEKAQFGLGNYMPQMNKDAWYSSILSGQEPEMRVAAAAAVKQKDTQDRLTTLQQTNTLPPPKPADPQSIIEQEFAQKFMSPMVDVKDSFYKGSFYGKANIVDPSLMDRAVDVGANIGRNLELYKNTIQATLSGFQQGMEEAGPIGQWDQGAGLLPLPKAEADVLGYPFELLAHTLSGVVRGAQQGSSVLLKGLGLRQNQAESAGNEIAAMVEAELGGLTGRHPVGKPVVEAVSSAVRAMASHDGTRPIEAIQASVHGDLEKAAEVQTAADMDTPITEKSETQRDIHSLMSVFRLNMDQIKANPGFGGQDLVNRIQAANDRFVDELSKKVETVQKVNRTPRAIAQSDVIREEFDRLRGNFRGWGNALINTEFDPVADFNQLTNSYSTRSYIGTYDGTLFKDKETAELQAPLMGVHLKTDPNDVGAIVVNRGSGWAVQLRTPFLEAPRDAIHSALLGNSETGLASTKDSRTPRSWLSSLSLFKRPGMLASPPQAMARTEMQNRRITAHTPSVIKEIANPDWKIINSIHKDSWSRFNQLLEYGRDLYDKDGNKGYFFESPGEIEDWHTLLFPNAGRPPSDMIEGYFAYKRLYNMDLALRNISAYQFASRMGMEQHQFTVKESNSGQDIKSDWVKAQRMNTLPAGNDPVLILGKDKGVDDDIVSAKELGTTKRGTQIKEDIQTGKANVFEVWDPSVEDFSKVSYKAKDQKPRYVVTYGTHETKPLDVGQMVPHRGGGHFDYKWQGASVQPKIRYDKITDSYIYDGDRIITMHDHPGEGKDFVWRMNTVRKYMLEGMHDVGQASAKSLLHMGPERFNQWFKEMRTPEGGRVPPYLDYDSPVVYVHKGESSIKHPVICKKFRDGTTSGSAAAQFKVQYTGERDSEDLFTARNKGTWNNPLWEYEPTKMVNALPTLGRAINRIANSQAADPQKIASITHWLKEAYPYMDKRTQREVWSAPWRVFNSDEIKWNEITENQQMIKILKGNRLKIKSFSGAFNPEERLMYSITTKLAEKLYEKRNYSMTAYGPPGTEPITGVIKPDVVPSWMLPFMADPWTVMRSITVHPILGLYKLSALPMQLTTFANVIGIAGPRHAGAGFMGALMHEFTRLNAHPNTLKLFDTFAQGFGWKKGEFIDAYELMHTTGFWNVAGEHGAVNLEDYNPIKSVAKSVLNAGMKPFQEGAQFVRAASWYTAYHEYRRGGWEPGGLENFDPKGTPLEFKQNAKGEWEFDQSSHMPIKKQVIGREDVAKILNRAGLLDHNMSRAATADYQKGPGSIPFNFWSYRQRLTEMMLGFGGARQLTRAEKISLVAVQTLLFGPLYGPLGVTGVGIDEYIREHMLSGEWNIPFTNVGIHSPKFITGENWWLSTFIHGLPAGLVAWATSDPKSTDPNKKRGDWFDFDEHFGVTSVVSDVLRDPTLLTLIAGAPGSKMSEYYAKSHPLGYDIYNWIVNHDKGTTLNDLNEAARVVNAYNILFTGFTAANTHIWKTKSGAVLQSDVSANSAFFQALMGVTDQQSQDAFDRARVMRVQTEVEQTAFKEATKEFHFMIDAKRNNDDEAANAHMVKWNSILAVAGITEDTRVAAFVERSLKNYEENLPGKINKKFFKVGKYGTTPEDNQRAIEQGLIEPDKTDNSDVIKPKRGRRR